MNNLKVGFARIDNTPVLGVQLDGYFVYRPNDGVLDPLMIDAIAFSDGERQAIFIACDMVNVDNDNCNKWRKSISEKTGVPASAIYITASHTHTAPGAIRPEKTYTEVAKEFYQLMGRRVTDAAVLALADLAPAKMGFGIGKAENVSFCRRYRMKDGSCQTNPGVNNPDIVSSINEVDTRVSVLRFDREGKDTVTLVNFANHPDTVGGTKVSADWPGFMRRTVETVFPGTKCAFCNGAQGDINHVNVHPTKGYSNDLFNDFDDVARGYKHAQYIGRVVAAGVMQAFDKVEWTDVDSISTLTRVIDIPSNKPTEEEMPEAEYIWKMHTEGRDEELPYKGMMLTTKVAEAGRKIRFSDPAVPVNFEMELIGIRLGNIALVGIPGEPFSEVGNQIKEAKGFALVIPTCLTNGSMGYFPTYDAYAEGGYEAGSSRFKAGVAERIVKGAIELLDEIK